MNPPSAITRIIHKNLPSMTVLIPPAQESRDHTGPRGLSAMDAGPRGLTGIQWDSLHTGISRPITGRRREPPDRYGREVRNHCSVERPCNCNHNNRAMIAPDDDTMTRNQDLADVGESTDRLGPKSTPKPKSIANYTLR